ncbi:MAG: SMC-Scp complex subunit ScpB [Candidatus Liptonbacteria bacterium]|nr:SMC-Scp complex subunit ScpB [Candidatus Liptonbacteria bacterium]
MNNLEAKVEALLFIYGEPTTFNHLALVLEVEEKDIREAVLGLAESLKSDNRGIKLIVDGNKIQFVTKQEFGSLIEKVVKDELREELTPASLETLSIIAYLGPVMRSTIEYIRGVNSDFILRKLLIRGLAEKIPHPNRNNIYLYAPSFELLKYFGINSVEELPEYPKYRELLHIFEKNT